ncbi:Proline utilization trans-activator [Colletotrichum sp. SAR 10_96]|nr:Proline utilization trans-activator [Colletotrichum sp. SAR 10_96]
MQWKPLGLNEEPDVSNLPPLDYAMFLFNTAKFYLGAVFYLIDEKSFMKNLHEFYDDPAAKASSSRLWYAQYLLILAFGKAFVVNQSSSHTGPAGVQYATRAMSLLPDLSGLEPDTISSIQALALAAVYFQCLDMRLAAFQHIGQALRISIVEGIYRHMPEEVVGVEHSRRCNIVFWVVYTLDREFSALMGAPSSIRDEDITVKLPSQMDNSLDALNMTLHVRLSRLMARILTRFSKQSVEDGLEAHPLVPPQAFLPFQLEDAFSSAFLLYLVRVIDPSLLHDDTWCENIKCVLDKMISKGSLVAPLRKLELSQLENIMTAFTPAPEQPPTPSPSTAHPQHHDHSSFLDQMDHEEPGWDIFDTSGMGGLSPQALLDLAERLDVEDLMQSVDHEVS